MIAGKLKQCIDNAFQAFSHTDNFIAHNRDAESRVHILAGSAYMYLCYFGGARRGNEFGFKIDDALHTVGGVFAAIDDFFQSFGGNMR